MPDGSGRIPPVAFRISDEDWTRIFGNTSAKDVLSGPSKRLDVPAENCGSGVQAPQPPEDEEVRGVQ